MPLDLSKLAHNDLLLSSLVFSGVRKWLEHSGKAALAKDIVAFKFQGTRLVVLVKSSIAMSELRLCGSDILRLANEALDRASVERTFETCVFRLWNPES